MKSTTKTMTFILNLTALPILGVLAVVLFYCQLGFIAAFFVALIRTFKKLSNIKFLLLYLFLLAFTAGLAYLIARLTMWVGEYADFKIWGYVSGCIITLVMGWKIVPQFYREAKNQTNPYSV